MNALLDDIRFALRGLLRRPLFNLLVIGVLALGIGATSAMFAIVDGVMFSPPPFSEPDRVVAIHAPQLEVPRAPLSGPDFVDWERDATSFAAMGAAQIENLNLTIGDEPRRMRGFRVSGGYFDVLGLPALHGRLLDRDDDAAGRQVAVIGYRAFVDDFGADSAIVGSQMLIDREPYEVVGVSAADHFVSAQAALADIALPLGMSNPGHHPMLSERGAHGLMVVGRLAPGTSAEAAEAELRSIAQRLERAHPQTNSGVTAMVDSLRDQLLGSSREQLLLLLGAIAFVLLLACANAASLLLSRGAGRRGELALRRALGASRSRIVQQLVTEAAVLGLLGAGFGVVVALWAVDLLLTVLQGSLPPTAAVAIEPSTVLFAAVVGVAAGVMAGIAPAWSTSRTQAHAALKEGAARATADKRASRVQDGLVMAEVAIAIALLSGAGLLLTSYVELQKVDVGVHTERVETAYVSLPEASYADGPAMARFVRRLTRRLDEDPEVVSAAVISHIPLGGQSTNGTVAVEGRTDEPYGQAPLVERRLATPETFETLGVPILRGRDFDEGDREGGRPVMIVNQAFADRFFPGEDAIGKRVKWETDNLPFAEIVGVVGNYLHDGPAKPVRRESYLPFDQAPKRMFAIAVETASDDAGPEVIRRGVRSVDPMQPVYESKSFAEVVDGKVKGRRSTMVLLGVFAGVAILLAALGIFGVVSHQTTRRTREVGIRLALGAAPWNVVGLIVCQAMRIVGWGVVAGLALAILTGQLLAEMVSDVMALDVGIYLAVVVGVTAVGLVASLLPARRAALVAPATALRFE